MLLQHFIPATLQYINDDSGRAVTRASFSTSTTGQQCQLLKQYNRCSSKHLHGSPGQAVTQFGVDLLGSYVNFCIWVLESVGLRNVRM